MTERETDRSTDELGTEVPAADAAEQAQPVSRDESVTDELTELTTRPLEVDPADHAEQLRDVPPDDEEYR